MKLFSVIFSMYMLGLMLIPCVDVHSENNAEISISVESHSNEADSCTPFCFCECCQTISHQVIFYNLLEQIVIVEKISFQMEASENLFNFSFWHPPKI